MRLTRQIAYLLRTVFHKREMDAELREELRYHVERDAEERVRGGVSGAEASRAALATFGGVTRIAEEATDARGLRWLDDLVTDVRYTARLIRRNPGFSAITILVAAFGIGATTLVFSAVNGVLLRPLPFTEPGRLMMLTFRGPDRTPSLPDPEFYATLSHPTAAFDDVGAYSIATAVVSEAGEPQMVRMERMSTPLMNMLGVPAAIGRVFTDDESKRDEPVAVLGHAFWRQHFGGDSSIIGRTIRLDDAPYVVIGVMPATFQGPLLRAPDVYLPLRLFPLSTAAGRPMRRPQIVVRLRKGLTAVAALQWVKTNVRTPGIQMITGESVMLTPQLNSLQEIVAGDVKQPLVILLVAVGFVLALVIANVSTLLLARASAREREMAMRRALGASRTRQVRQVLTETLVLSGLGGLLGVVVARFGLVGLRGAGVNILPRLSDITLDWRVLSLAAGLTVVCGLVAGLIPALTGATSQGDLVNAMKPTGLSRAGLRGGWSGLRAAFVMIEVALSVVLLVGAGLIIKGFLRVAPTEPGFAVDNRVVLSLQFRDSATYDDPSAQSRWLFAQDAMRRMRALPGVRDVAITSTVPLVRMTMVRDVKPQSQVQEAEHAVVRSHERAVSANYFELLNIPIVAGRGLARADDAGGEPVAVVNQTAAARWFPGQSPVGRRFSFATGRGGARRSFRIVGVARDARFEGTDTRTRPEFFVPYAQAPTQPLNFIVVTSSDPLSLSQSLKQQIWAIDPKLPVDDVESLTEIAGDSVREARFYSLVMAAFAVVALGIAAAGMFGMLSYMVTQRQREIGIRLALGAPRRSIGGLVLRQTAVIAGLGLVAGSIAARMLTGFLSALLLEVSPTDAKVFAASAAGLAIVAVVASMGPVRRASSVDPIRSLRAE